MSAAKVALGATEIYDRAASNAIKCPMTQLLSNLASLATAAAAAYDGNPAKAGGRGSSSVAPLSLAPYVFRDCAEENSALTKLHAFHPESRRDSHLEVRRYNDPAFN